MMTYARKLSIGLAVIAAILVGTIEQSDAGLFRGRLRARFARSACSSCNVARAATKSCGCDPCQCNASRDCGAACAAKADCPECRSPEALQLQREALIRNSVREQRFDRALYLFSLVHQDQGGIVKAVNKLRSSPTKMAEFRTAVQAKYGISIDSVADLLRLLLDHADEIIVLILQIVSMI